MPILHQGWTLHVPLRGKITPLQVTLDPGPRTSCPQLEQDAFSRAFFPLSCIQGHGLVPTTWWHRWTNGKLLPFAKSLLFLLAPLAQMAVEGACRAKSCMDGSTTEHGGNICGDRLRERHHRTGIALCRMG